jgi:hypothetical protein
MMTGKVDNFFHEIYELQTKKKMDTIDAVVHWCEINSIELELVADLIKKDPLMTSRIQVEAENLNYLKKHARLPV